MERYFEGFFREMPTPCVMLRPNHGQYTICAANKAYLELVNRSHGALVNQDFCVLFPDLPVQETFTATRDLLDRVMRSKKTDTAPPLFYPTSSLSDGIPEKPIWMQTTYVPVLDRDGNVEIIVRMLKDVTDAMHILEMDTLLDLERRILALNASVGVSMKRLLADYLAGVELLFPGMYCSILQVFDNRLKSPIAPSIPETFLPDTISLPIEEGAGSCGTAAYRKRLVVVADIANDPIWEGPRELALAHGFRACWSYPIIDANNSLLAVLGMYYKEVKKPNDNELGAIHRVASLLRILLENRKNANLVAEAVETLNQVQELASFGIWQWDTITGEMTWSNILYAIFGIAEAHFNNRKDGFLELIVDEDRARVVELLEQVRKDGRDAIFEARIRRSDGTIRHLRFWVKLVKGGKYHPRIVGACLDITPIRLAESDLKEIAWMQSHIIRAPVARILGLADLIREYPEADIPTAELLEGIYNSAQELDELINMIVDKAKQNV